MRVAIVDSGLGLLSTAAALRRARPGADLILSMDPDGMPWGSRAAVDVIERVLAGVRAAAAYGPGIITLACNTASVTALGAVRAEFEPEIPVVGTVPAIKPAAAEGGPIAVWATPATTASRYQRALIERFAAGLDVIAVTCPGLADAIEAAADPEIDRAIEAAASATPAGVAGVVLGCTHYDLVADRIRGRLQDRVRLGDAPRLYTAAPAVARQTLARASPAAGDRGDGKTIVLASGRAAPLPPPALAYAEGRLLAQ